MLFPLEHGITNVNWYCNVTGCMHQYKLEKNINKSDPLRFQKWLTMVQVTELKELSFQSVYISKVTYYTVILMEIMLQCNIKLVLFLPV